eukprot:COSAG06_NODE_3451_length_5323_cov_4.349732_2_plen_155_part_00
MWESSASLLLALERFDESEAEFAELLEANADNYEYHTGLQCAHCKVVQKREHLQSSQPFSMRPNAACWPTLNASQQKIGAATSIGASRGDQFVFVLSRAAEQWSTAHTDSLVKLYDEMLKKNSKAYTAQRIVLNFVDGEKPLLLNRVSRCVMNF